MVCDVERMEEEDEDRREGRDFYRRAHSLLVLGAGCPICEAASRICVNNSTLGPIRASYKQSLAIRAIVYSESVEKRTSEGENKPDIAAA